VADYLSTMGYCVPNHITIDVEGLPELFLWEVVCFNKLLQTIELHQRPQLASIFLSLLFKYLRIKWKLTISFHPETEVETELVNVTIKQYLWVLVNYQKPGWVRWLTLDRVWVVLATVPDRWFGYGSMSEPNHIKIDCPSRQSTPTTNVGTVRSNSPNSCQLGGLSVGCPGTSKPICEFI
jgi:hypothetical protein